MNNNLEENKTQNVIADADFLFTRLQNSRIVCEPERRGKYSNERSGAGVETVRKAGRVRLAPFTRENYAYGASRLPNMEEGTTVLQFIHSQD